MLYLASPDCTCGFIFIYSMIYPIWVPICSHFAYLMFPVPHSCLFSSSSLDLLSPPLLLLLPSPLSSSLLPIWDNKKNISKAESAQSPRHTHAHTHVLWYNPTLKLCLPFFFLVLLLSKPRFPSVIFIWLFESFNNALRDRGTRSTWGEIGREK